MLNFYFDITLIDEETDLNLYNDLISEIKNDENISSKKLDEENSVEEDDELYFTEFFPNVKKIGKTKRKYKEVVEENELKKFLDSLPLSNKKLKDE